MDKATELPVSRMLNSRICLFLSAIPLAAGLLLAPDATAEPPPAIPGADAAIAKAESALGSDRFGPYGCEAFVAFAYDVPQAKYGWDGASETMYQTLLAQGQIHTDMNAPRGALVFSKGSDGPHIDIARGDGLTSPAASKDSREDTATGTTFRFFPAPMWPANGSTAGGVWAIHDKSQAARSCAGSIGKHPIFSLLRTM